MIPAISNKDKIQLKKHALKLLRKKEYEGLVILVRELKYTELKLPKFLDLEKFMITAAKCNHLDIIKFLHAQGVSLDSRSARPLVWASYNGNVEIVKFIFEQTPEVDKCANNFALGWAAANGHLEVVKYLVEQGMTIRTHTEDPIKNAAQNGHLEVVSYLYSKLGSQIDDLDDVLVAASSDGQLEIVRFLLREGVSVKNFKALEEAVSNGYLEIVKYLAGQGADVREKDDHLLAIAVREEHLGIVRFLIKKGANVNIQNGLLLQIASRVQNKILADQLLQAGANIQMAIKDSVTKKYLEEVFKYDFSVHN